MSLTHAGRSSRHLDVALVVPLIGAVAVLPDRLKAPLNLFDEGLQLTLGHFSSLHTLVHRDLWTFYGPVTSIYGPLIDAVAGRTFIAYRVVDLLVLLALVVGMYRVSCRLVGRWTASAMALTVVLIDPPISYTGSLVFVVWGLEFILRAEDGTRPGEWHSGRLASGMSLVGFAFMGRHEFSYLTPIIVAAVLTSLWKELRPQQRGVALLGGLGPTALYGLYLLSFVPWSTLREVFYNYPVHFYSLSECRGIPTPWGSAAKALIGPAYHVVWTAGDIVLGLGTYVAPMVGLILVVLGIGTHQPRLRLLYLYLGIWTLFLFALMRPRNGGSPRPVLPLVLLAIAALLEWWRRSKAGPAVRAERVLATVLVIGGIVSFAPGTVDRWAHWPAYDRVLGFLDPSPSPLAPPRVLRQITDEVDHLTEPAEPIFVALNNNQGHFANAAALYWILDRPPASNYFEFAPCLTDRPDIQTEIVHDLAAADVVVTTTFWPLPPPLPDVSTILDDYLAANFQSHRVWVLEPTDPDAFAQRYEVLVRKS